MRGGGSYVEPYVAYVEGDNSVHYNKPKFFCKLTLSDDSVIELEGSGELTSAMKVEYSATCVSAEIGTKCTSIGQNAFSQGYNKSFSALTSITISDSVTSIGIAAFQFDSNIVSVKIGNSVTNIERCAFQGCSSLTSVTIPNSVVNIKFQAFYGCVGISSLFIGNHVTTIEDEAFYLCQNLNNITCNAATAPTITSDTFQKVKTNGVLYVPSGSSGYEVWMQNANYYLGLYNWTKVEQ